MTSISTEIAVKALTSAGTSAEVFPATSAETLTATVADTPEILSGTPTSSGIEVRALKSRRR